MVISVTFWYFLVLFGNFWSKGPHIGVDMPLGFVSNFNLADLSRTILFLFSISLQILNRSQAIRMRPSEVCRVNPVRTNQLSYVCHNKFQVVDKPGTPIGHNFGKFVFEPTSKSG